VVFAVIVQCGRYFSKKNHVREYENYRTHGLTGSCSGGVDRNKIAPNSGFSKKSVFSANNVRNSVALSASKKDGGVSCRETPVLYTFTLGGQDVAIYLIKRLYILLYTP